MKNKCVACSNLFAQKNKNKRREPAINFLKFNKNTEKSNPTHSQNPSLWSVGGRSTTYGPLWSHQSFKTTQQKVPRSRPWRSQTPQFSSSSRSDGQSIRLEPQHRNLSQKEIIVQMYGLAKISISYPQRHSELPKGVIRRI